MASPEFWRGKRVLLTGHTGFKSAWLCLWLESLGAEVTGFAGAAPSAPALFDLARCADGVRSIDGDVRDLGAAPASRCACARPTRSGRGSTSSTR